MKKLEKIGVQLYTVRDYLENEADAEKTFKRLKDMGYDEAQTAGCAFSYETFGKLAKEAGIEIVGTHDDFGLMLRDTPAAIARHEALGTKIMGTGGFFPDDRSMKPFYDYAEQVNQVAKVIGPLGYKYTYHNHSHEFWRFGDEMPFQYLVDHLDPTYTSFCLDTYWVQNGGGDVRHWIETLAGRIDILHLKEMGNRADKGTYITEIGNGNLYWEGILEQAEKSGVKYYCVEQDCNWIDDDPFKSLEKSSEYLHKHFM